MVFYAIVATIFYAIALISLAAAFVYKRKNNPDSYESLMRTALICLTAFVGFTTVAILMQDPIPFWGFVVFTGVIFASLGVGLYPDYIAVKVRHALSEPESEIKIRTLSFQEARRQISEYLEHSKREVWIEDIIDDLRIDPELVVRVIEKLKKEGKIK